ncbi:MAG TPA: serine/threonine-protein kinase [Gemmataceae bacterium]|nr:serine/threonine-protein kinase [Gemmataceae bacterium]
MTPEREVNPERLEELFHLWREEMTARGRELSAAELCRDCPELAPELERRIRIVRRFEALLEPADGITVRTSIGLPVVVGPDREAVPTPPGYEILGKVGEGGMGVVYKARHLALNRIEALKMVRAGEFAGPHELARFRFEAEATAGLEHPNIVTVYGVGEVNGRPYLAMRWVDGSRLADRRPGSPRASAALMAKVARAVHYAHHRGILHRDLKPANILIDAAGEPFVADFGVARRLDPDSTVSHGGGLVGTPAYMSPEQASGSPNLTVASDVYALGVVLFELLTGHLPFLGTSCLELLKQVVEAQPVAPRKLNPAIDPDLDAICMKCLEKEPGDRYPSAVALADDLERFLRGEAVAARPPGLWDWLRQVWRTRPESTAYSWQVLSWFGAIILPTHAAVFGLAAAGSSAAGVWLVQMAGWAALGVVIWWYLLRRFRRLPGTERHSTMIAVAHMVGHIGLLVALVPLSFERPAREALRLYPPLIALSGMGCIVVGSTHWGRFVPIGLGVMALVPVTAWWPEVSPLIYGIVIAGVMWYWAYALGVTFASDKPGV